jgi:hypothetical protein
MESDLRESDVIGQKSDYFEDLFCEVLVFKKLLVFNKLLVFVFDKQKKEKNYIIEKNYISK